MKIKKITILGGFGKERNPEKVQRCDLKMGEIVSIVGQTGCGIVCKQEHTIRQVHIN